MAETKLPWILAKFILRAQAIAIKRFTDSVSIKPAVK